MKAWPGENGSLTQTILFSSQQNSVQSHNHNQCNRIIERNQSFQRSKAYIDPKKDGIISKTNQECKWRLETEWPSQICGTHSYTKSDELTIKWTYRTLIKISLISSNQVFQQYEKFIIKVGRKGVLIWFKPDLNQFVLGSGIGNNPAPAPLGGENPRNFCRLVLMLMEQRKYKNAIAQSVGSSPCNPRWLIFITSPKGLNGNLATTLPSKSELSNPKTTNRTRATTAPDLNLKSERSRLDSLRLVSTRSIFFVLDFLTVILELSVFMVSSFLAALSMEDRRVL